MSNTSNSDLLATIKTLSRKEQSLVVKKMKALKAERKYKQRKEDKGAG
jgi:hypothetical protein